MDPPEEVLKSNHVGCPLSKPRKLFFHLVLAVIASLIICVFNLSLNFGITEQAKGFGEYMGENASRESMKLNLTVTVHLSGAMANQLSYVAHGLTWYFMAQEEEFGFGKVSIALKPRCQYMKKDGPCLPTRKAKDITRILKMCFPWFAKFEFLDGNSEEYVTMKNLQNKLNLGTKGNLLQGMKYDGMRRHLHRFAKISQDLNEIPEWGGNYSFTNISLPILDVKGLDAPPIPLYHEKIFHQFAFDESCCNAVPDSDESVFHFRNFVGEFGGINADSLKIYEELSPTKIAEEVFANLTAGDKIAIVTSNKDKTVDAIVDQLTLRGLLVRVITGQKSWEDFCFLLKAKKEMVGVVESTYAVWAAYLGNSSLARLYTVDSFGMRKQRGTAHFLEHDKQPIPEMKSRIKNEVYRTEEVDKAYIQGTLSRNDVIDRLVEKTLGTRTHIAS